MEGVVKFFNRKKGFGFISGNDGQDYFVHFTAVPRGVFLRDNDRVSFEPAEGDRGLKAEKVQLLEKASERAQADNNSQENSQEEESYEASEEEETSDEDMEESDEEATTDDSEERE